MSRFSIDINEVSAERPLIPAGDYPIRIIKGSAKQGSYEKDGKINKYVNLNFTAVVKDEQVCQDMKQDEPKCFPSVFIRLDDQSKVDTIGNETFKKFCITMGFNDFSVFEDGTEDCETQDEFNAKMFTNLAEACVGADLLGKIGFRVYNDEKQNEVKSLAALPE